MHAADPIDRPPHYQSHGVGVAGNIEVVEVIDMYGLCDSWDLGSAAKYLLRAGRKGPARICLGKSLWHLTRFRDSGADGPFCVADEGDDPAYGPTGVATAFGLSGAHYAAVVALLRFADQTLPEPPPDGDGILAEDIDAVIAAVTAALAAEGVAP